MSETIRRLVGEEIYQERFADKEMEEKIGDKRSSPPMSETRAVKIKRDDPVQISTEQEEETRNELKKVDTNYICKACGKLFARLDGLYRHKTYHCKARISTLKLEWNGDTWLKSENRVYNRLQIGRNLFNLIEKKAIKEDVLNCAQREYVNMYKSLFSE